MIIIVLPIKLKILVINRSPLLIKDQIEIKPFHKIPLITKSLYDHLKPSYIGGAVDVIRPYGGGSCTVLYYYDKNSLYPFVMNKYPMPTGTPIYFEGDIFKFPEILKDYNYKYYDDPFGFFTVKVTSPKYMKVPILQRRLSTKNMFNTIAGLGS
jgi:hypothetical protein